MSVAPRFEYLINFGWFLSHFVSILSFFYLRAINARCVTEGGQAALFTHEIDFTIILQIWTSSFRNKLTIFPSTGFTIINLVKK